MSSRAVVKQAMDLMQLPSQVRLVRSAPLPDDVQVLLRIAAGESKAVSEAAESAGCSDDVVREAAKFFIEQAMLFPGADSYRILGAKPKASYSELRQNMSLLLRWLHPDGDRHEARGVFVPRVTQAWEDLKTADRREAYDQSIRQSMKARSSRHRKGRVRSPSQNLQRRPIAKKQKWTGRHLSQNDGLLRRLLVLLYRRIRP